MRISWDELADHLKSSGFLKGDITKITSAGGGCINDSYRIQDSQTHTLYFVKFNRAGLRQMFEAEYSALKEMKEMAKTLESGGNGQRPVLITPKPLLTGQLDDLSYLVMEYLPLTGRARSRSQWSALGAGLAQLHTIHQPEFGWHRNNTIGSTPQINNKSDDWVEFWRTCRLEPQVEMARNSGVALAGISSILECLEQFFDGYSPSPSLLHGDLWSGNFGFIESGQYEGAPVLFDPASYYGDREAEFGIIDMFGGFDAAFFDAYDSAFPRDEGFDIRLPLYRLYHELNHVNLFGHGYLSSVNQSIHQLRKSL